MAATQKRSSSTTPLEALLAAVEARPTEAVRAIRKALMGPNGAQIERALGRDKRCVPMLTSILADRAQLAKARWVMPYLARQGRPEVAPTLLAVWRTQPYALADEAAKALLALGARDALKAMVDDLKVTRLKNRAVEAGLKLCGDEGDELHRLLAPHLDGERERTVALYTLARHPKVFRGSQAWRRQAARDLACGGQELRDAAQRAIRAALSKQEQAELARQIAAKPPSPRPTTDTSWVDALRAKLPATAWTPADAKQRSRLEQLESMVGRLPGAMRAFYETFARIDAGSGKTRFEVVPLDEALQAAKRWWKTNSKRSPTLRDSFHFEVAPDGWTKAGYGGGTPVGFLLPCPDDDPKLLYVRGSPRFSVFVRRALTAAKHGAGTR